MSDFEYRKFPRQAEFTQKYRYKSDLRFLVRVMANLNGTFGMFNTYSPFSHSRRIQAKREIQVEIMDGMDFQPLGQDNVEEYRSRVPGEGTVDFKLHLKYSYLDEKYNPVPMRGDDYLVRAEQSGDVLILTVNLEEGPRRTESSRIADTIVDEIRRYASKPATQQH